MNKETVIGTVLAYRATLVAQAQLVRYPGIREVGNVTGVPAKFIILVGMPDQVYRRPGLFAVNPGPVLTKR